MAVVERPPVERGQIPYRLGDHPLGSVYLARAARHVPGRAPVPNRAAARARGLAPRLRLTNRSYFHGGA